MSEGIITFLNTVSVVFGVFLMTRYVFLEPAMEEKKQRLFYGISFSMIFFSFWFCYFTGLPDISSGLAVLCGGLNIALARKKHRLFGFLMGIPLTGLVNGFFAPAIFIDLLFAHDSALFFFSLLAVYACFFCFLLVFYFKGKAWRKWFRETMANRRPQMNEYVVLCFSGVFLMVSSIVVMGISSSELPTEAGVAVKGLVAVFELCAFLLTLTIIVLIMQGNSRKFYHDRVSNMQFNVIATMADIVENRDANTGGHIKRTAKYVEIIGKNLRKKNAFGTVLSEQYLSDMIVAAPLHDIGKVSIPDAILNKAGKLTEEEFEIMKTHTTAGRDVLQKAEKQLGEFNYLEVALDMAESHHEWWNGTGYPAGKSGEEIPLCARIMAVADVFDALTSKRCYKAAMPLEKAYGIIREESGTHFDPVVAEAFLASAAEVEAAFYALTDD